MKIYAETVFGIKNQRGLQSMPKLCTFLRYLYMQVREYAKQKFVMQHLLCCGIVLREIDLW